MPASVRPSGYSHAHRGAPVHPAARAVTGPRSWLALLALLIVCGAVFALVQGGSTSGGPAGLPQDAESQLVADELAEFPDGDVAPLIGVGTRVDGGATAWNGDGRSSRRRAWPSAAQSVSSTFVARRSSIAA